ncbi:hypothetical protein BH11CYA1_BH11CYA1_26220 [soil metagenome]
MSRKILSFSLASILSAIGLASCTDVSPEEREELTMPNANILSLEELYRRDKQSFEDDYNCGNFLQMTDGTVLFFKPSTRLDLDKVMTGTLTNYNGNFLAYSPTTGKSSLEKMEVAKHDKTLAFDSYRAKFSELERTRLTSDWRNVINFCASRKLQFNEKFGRISVGVKDASIVRLKSDYFLVTGGQSTYSSPDMAQMATVFDSKTDSIVKQFVLCSRRRNHISLLLPDGKVMLAGGQQEHGPQSRPTIEIVDVDAQVSRELDSHPASFRTFGTACLDEKGNCLVMSGMGLKDRSMVDLDTIELIDVKADTISVVGYMSYYRLYNMKNEERVVTLNAIPIGSEKILISGGKYRPRNSYQVSVRDNAEIIELGNPPNNAK